MKIVLTLLTSLLFVGCGNSEYSPVPVSGLITVDGTPRSDLVVTFIPLDVNDQGEAGPPSAGKTDGEGKFSLTQRGGKKGATPGNYKVTIFTEESAKPDADPTDDNVYTNSKPDPIPTSYNTESTLTFEVPVGGTDKADFQVNTQ